MVLVFAVGMSSAACCAAAAETLLLIVTLLVATAAYCLAHCLLLLLALRMRCGLLLLAMHIPEPLATCFGHS